MKRNEFIEYCLCFYGENGLYPEFFNQCPLSIDDLNRALDLRLVWKEVPFCGDTLDRELIRDILFVLKGKAKISEVENSIGVVSILSESAVREYRKIYGEK